MKEDLYQTINYENTLDFWLWTGFGAAAILFCIIYILIRIGRRRGWFGKRFMEKKVEVQKFKCPLCGSQTETLYPMPKVTERPKTKTWPWFKTIRHWEILPNPELKVCFQCYTDSWAAAMKKREEIHVRMARDLKDITDNLYDFEQDLYMPLSIRASRNGKKEG